MPLTLPGLPCPIFLSPTLRSGAARYWRADCSLSVCCQHTGCLPARLLFARGPAQLALPDLAATSFLPTEPRYQSIAPASILPPDSLIAPPHNSQHYAQSQGFGARLDEYPKEPPNTAMTYNTSVQLRTQSFTSSAYEIAMPHFPSLMNPAFNRYSNSAGAPPSAQIAPSTSPFNLSHPSSSTASAPIPQPPLPWYWTPSAPPSPLPLMGSQMHLERHHLQDLVPRATFLRALLLAANEATITFACENSIDITTTLKSEVSPELLLSHPFESDLRSPETPSYDDSSPPPADDPVVNYARNSWWDELLNAYAPTREQAFKDISNDLKRKSSPSAIAIAGAHDSMPPERAPRRRTQTALRGGPHITYKSQRILRIDGSIYRSRYRTQLERSSFKSNPQRDEKNKCDVQQRRHLRAHVCGVVGDRRRSPAHATASTTPAATCTTPADQRQRTTRSIASPAAATAPASRGSSWLTQGSKTVLRVSNSVLKSRERVRDKSDLASGEKHSLANYLKHKRQGRHRIPAHAFTTPATLRPANAAQPKTSAPPRKTDSSVQDMSREHSRHPTLMRSDTRDRHALTLICHPLADRAEDNQGHHQPQERRQRPQSRTQQTRDDFTHSTRLASAQTQQQPTPAIGTGTTSERLRRTRMTEDSQDLALLLSLYSPTLSALLHAF
ncbi:hypothetical protein EDB85DRAFT_2153959 [Lactarius pseudohatsudake]|nr:hypothetical protein EDB85DRAFT_2153959 [Lactarius pseudohatsudake]